ncbi:ribosome-associated translation inhibitor RaiA [Candidatus Puniceispirillum sp.]|jgi:ribosomal subunit interface protein|uniref:ribosome hibernation-promoting factor, HPF/YfiA family n=1 Tax=Candidatus Puniceispirillum sp. TaxID=2026719 RepID=UPI001ED38BE5|nr:ribosome-associated translation inhibitor RaiA [Candidatus Puniceispirillum sp.]
MQINISGKNMDTGAAFQEHAHNALNNVVEKYFQNAVSGHITLEKAESGFTVRARVALSRRIELEATGQAGDAHTALDAAMTHAEKRLRRHKRRLKNHRNAVTIGEEEDAIMTAPMKVYASSEQVNTSDDAKSDEELVPVFADMSYDIETLSVDQAVMRLELSGANMLMFRNANHLGLNVVHFREDGTIGWIDPRGMRRMGVGA